MARINRMLVLLIPLPRPSWPRTIFVTNALRAVGCNGDRPFVLTAAGKLRTMAHTKSVFHRYRLGSTGEFKLRCATGVLENEVWRFRSGTCSIERCRREAA